MVPSILLSCWTREVLSNEWLWTAIAYLNVCKSCIISSRQPSKECQSLLPLDFLWPSAVSYNSGYARRSHLLRWMQSNKAIWTVGILRVDKSADVSNVTAADIIFSSRRILRLLSLTANPKTFIMSSLSMSSFTISATTLGNQIWVHSYVSVSKICPWLFVKYRNAKQVKCCTFHTMGNKASITNVTDTVFFE